MNVNPGWLIVVVPQIPIVQKATEMVSPPNEQPFGFINQGFLNYNLMIFESDVVSDFCTCCMA